MTEEEALQKAREVSAASLAALSKKNSKLTTSYLGSKKSTSSPTYFVWPSNINTKDDIKKPNPSLYPESEYDDSFIKFSDNLIQDQIPLKPLTSKIVESPIVKYEKFPSTTWKSEHVASYNDDDLVKEIPINDGKENVVDNRPPFFAWELNTLLKEDNEEKTDDIEVPTVINDNEVQESSEYDAEFHWFTTGPTNI